MIYGKESPAELNIRRVALSEIQEGDYFFLSSDGIMEQVDQRDLATILRTGQAPEFLVPEIENLCKGLTQDDFSCVLIQVDRVKEGSSFAPVSNESLKETVPSTSVEEPIPAAAGAATAESVDPEPEAVPAVMKEGEEPARSIFSTRVFYMVLGACAVLALIGVTLEGIGIGGNKEKNYDLYVQNGKDLMDAGEYSRAVSVLDSAVTFAPDKATQIRATELKKTAVQKLETFNLMAKMSFEELVEAGKNKFMQNEWSEAIAYFEQAQVVAQQDSIDLPEDFRENLIQSYFKFAQLYDQGESANLAKSLELYQKGLNVEATEDIKRDIDYQNALNRVAELSNELNAPEDDGLLADNSGSESMNDPFDESPETPGPAINPNPIPANDVEPSTPSTGKVRSASTSSQKQHLRDGKALFERAKQNNSRSLYSESIEKFENAGSGIDGIGAYLLSVMHHEGRGGTKNEDKALEYASLSARKGYSQGHFYYAHLLLLREKRGDTITALESLKIAAQDDHIPAINRLNKMGMY